MPLPPGATSGSLAGVAATGPADVWAVGTASGKALVEHWNGSSWTPGTAADLPPQRAGASVVDHLSAVTAISPTNVWAAGGSTDTVTGSFLPDRTLVEHWNGSRWTLTSSPSPATHNFLTAVAATNATDVWAIGADWSDQAVGVPVEKPLILHGNGTAWATATPPAPVGTSDNFANGAAAAPGVVWAVGGASGGAPALRHTG